MDVTTKPGSELVQLYTLLSCGHYAAWTAQDREPVEGMNVWCDQHRDADGPADELVRVQRIAQAAEKPAPKLERQPHGWATGKLHTTPHGPGYRVVASDHQGDEIADTLLHVVKHGDRWSAYAGDELVVDGRATRAAAANRLAWELADRARRA